MTVTCGAAVIFYYISLLLFSTELVSGIIQPELNQEFYQIVSSAKAMVTIVLLPIVALVPDLSYILIKKLFRPNPTDFVLRI